MKKILKSSLYIIVSILVGVTAVYATTKLTAPSAPTNTMYSLTDIYNLSSGTLATEGTGTIETTPSTIGETGKTLKEVYTALSTEISKLSADKIKSGTTAFGIAGTLTGAPAPLTWQTDPALNLCWSTGQYETDNGCSVGSGWIDASVAQDGSLPLGAVEYCQYLNTDGTTLATTPQNIWHLPTIKEYQSITDFTTYNNATQVPGFAQNSNYWSSSEGAEGTNYAWFWDIYYGGISYYGKDNQFTVRCAR